MKLPLKRASLSFCIFLSLPLQSAEPHWKTGENRPETKYFKHLNAPPAILTHPCTLLEEDFAVQDFITNGPRGPRDTQNIIKIAQKYPPMIADIWLNLALAAAYCYHGYALNPTDPQKNIRDSLVRCQTAIDDSQQYLNANIFPDEKIWEVERHAKKLKQYNLQHPDFCTISYVLESIKNNNKNFEDLEKAVSFGKYFFQSWLPAKTNLLVATAEFAHKPDDERTLQDARYRCFYIIEGSKNKRPCGNADAALIGEAYSLLALIDNNLKILSIN